MTNEEKELLEIMSNGDLDGCVGNDLYTSGGSVVWTEINGGVPQRLKQGPTVKSFNGKENEKIPGKKTILETWESEEEKLGFLQDFGWLIGNDKVRKYSAKYKRKK